MKVLEHEYKVMGLAAYSKEKYSKKLYKSLFEKIIWLSEDDNLAFDSKFDTSSFYDYLTENAIGERFDNLAGAVQMLTEKIVCKWIKNGLEKVPC